MRVWLHEMAGNETGWMAWCLDFHGFATWASSEAEVLGRVPAKLAEHRRWLAEHGLACPKVGGDVQVVERVRGNEILFSWDYAPCGADEIDLTLRLLSASRSDLVKTIGVLPEAALDLGSALSSLRRVGHAEKHPGDSCTHSELRDALLPQRGRPRVSASTCFARWSLGDTHCRSQGGSSRLPAPAGGLAGPSACLLRR
jgi:hypothetical protein